MYQALVSPSTAVRLPRSVTRPVRRRAPHGELSG
ncbi:hypothetical protein JOF53_006765 [Crossiella equi]|uniref:Uncharacterized protein n=1 Tax=Crossiella equi TaxID=130796 RepID=A0ABS5AMT2_9PSEU|nr:hypothetical protein [Crossiella equi]